MSRWNTTVWWSPLFTWMVRHLRGINGWHAMARLLLGLASCRPWKLTLVPPTMNIQRGHCSNSHNKALLMITCPRSRLCLTESLVSHLPSYWVISSLASHQRFVARWKHFNPFLIPKPQLSGICRKKNFLTAIIHALVHFLRVPLFLALLKPFSTQLHHYYHLLHFYPHHQNHQCPSNSCPWRK